MPKLSPKQILLFRDAINPKTRWYESRLNLLRADSELRETTTNAVHYALKGARTIMSPDSITASYEFFDMTIRTLFPLYREKGGVPKKLSPAPVRELIEFWRHYTKANCIILGAYESTLASVDYQLPEAALDSLRRKIVNVGHPLFEDADSLVLAMKKGKFDYDSWEDFKAKHMDEHRRKNIA